MRQGEGGCAKAQMTFKCCVNDVAQGANDVAIRTNNVAVQMCGEAIPPSPYGCHLPLTKEAY